MRRFFPLIVCCLFVASGRGSDVSPKQPEDFAYTEIYTAMSDAGTPVQTNVRRVTVSGNHQRIDQFDGECQIIDALTSRMVSIDSVKKTHTVHDRQRVINIVNGSQSESEIPNRPAANHYKALS